MRQITCSDEVIEKLVTANCGQHVSARERHIFREALRNLVRLARVEEAEALRMGIYPLGTMLDETVLH